MPHSHLTDDEREAIAHLYRLGHSFAEIARQLNRHATTISRELKRNSRGRRLQCIRTETPYGCY
ncbi:MAG: helix-turn-helix domain-containing protein [Planctomycetaceae bacterium]|nr:helix-turn-helix domain-containing protein [Planctomycetaceae bacterium]